MSRIIGTQEFLKEHVGHNVGISVVSTIDNRHSGIIHETPFGYVAVCEEKEEEEWVQDTGLYVFCRDCKVEEQEVNLNEVEQF